MDSILNLSPDQLGSDIVAIGALGTAAAALVDSFKSLPNGGPSNHGFSDIGKLLDHFLSKKSDADSATRSIVEDSLHSAWINGVALDSQKGMAKAQIKAALTRARAGAYASAAMMADKESLLADIADVLQGQAQGAAAGQAPALSAEQTIVFARFDFALTALADNAYQRADQRYRNYAKAWAMLAAVLLSELGAQVYAQSGDTGLFLKALVIGLLATPLAPVAKNASSAIANAAAALKPLYGKGTAQ